MKNISTGRQVRLLHFLLIFQSVDMDPCLDDCVMYAKRLKNLNNEISLDILQGLPHGFLNFVKVRYGFFESYFKKKIYCEFL